MRTIFSLKEIQSETEQLRKAGKKVGVVPTMGFLHEGHLSLIRKAKEISDVVVTTIFVNPTQFGVDEDFPSYPRDLNRDQSLAAKAGADIVFFPDTREMYPDGFKTYVHVDEVSSILEGKFRPNHFRGVTTVVTKLFNLTKPHIAFFGQKDAQQAFIVKKMAADLNMDVEIHVEPIVREADGLAISSRNIYLNSTERKNAATLYQSLKHAEALILGGERSIKTLRVEIEKIIHEGKPTQIDYVAFVDPNSFTEIDTVVTPMVLVLVAVRFGPTRLIDNMIISIH